jgi:hypothetical protein
VSDQDQPREAGVPPAGPVRYRYTGDGTTFLEGVPARDLTAEDVALLTEEQLNAVKASDLYEAKE